MPIAATNNAALRVIEEATFGTTPASPALKELRFTGESLVASKETVVSEVIRSDRQRDFLAEVAASAEGDVNTELAFGDELDLLLRGVLQSEFSISYIGTGRASGAQTIDAAAPSDPTVDGGTLTRAAGSFLTDGFTVGELIDLAGTTTEDGRYKIKAVTATVITVEPNIGAAPLSADTGAGTESVTNTVLGLDVVAATRTITRDDALNWADDGFAVGQWVNLSGFTTSSGANNGTYRVESLSGSDMVVQAGFGNQANLVDETGSGDEIAFQKRIENGTTPRSYTFEKDYNDITQFQSFQGMRFGSMALNVAVGEIVTATYTLSGRGNVQMDPSRSNLPTTGATEVAADTTEQMNATSNVGQLFENVGDTGTGTPLATCVNSIAMTIENNLRAINCVGEKFPREVNSGFVDVTGTLEAYFEDETLFNEFVNHTEANLVFTFADAAGNEIYVTLPRLFFSSGSPQVSGGNEDILLSMEFTAIRDQTFGKTVVFELVPASLP